MTCPTWQWALSGYLELLRSTRPELIILDIPGSARWGRS